MKSLILGLILIIILGFGTYFVTVVTKNLKDHREEPVACTLDAKLCPDGSYVGRIAPNCEFAPCPY
jgi:hypothetical protein